MKSLELIAQLEAVLSDEALSLVTGGQADKKATIDADDNAKGFFKFKKKKFFHHHYHH